MKHDNSHPDEAALVARYFGDADPTLDGHVARCSACAARDMALRATLDADRARLSGVADGYFTPARLNAQRAEVLARIEAPRRARVLAFQIPSGPPAPSPRLSIWRLRWLAAAAALIGVAGAGWIVGDTRGAWSRDGSHVSVQPLAPRNVLQLPEPDDAALAAIDVALARTGAPELVALDALTLQSATAPYGH